MSIHSTKDWIEDILFCAITSEYNIKSKDDRLINDHAASSRMKENAYITVYFECDQIQVKESNL